MFSNDYPGVAPGESSSERRNTQLEPVDFSAVVVAAVWARPRRTESSSVKTKREEKKWGISSISKIKGKRQFDEGMEAIQAPPFCLILEIRYRVHKTVMV